MFDALVLPEVLMPLHRSKRYTWPSPSSRNENNPAPGIPHTLATNAFTLIELLVVITIIAMLAAIMLPAVKSVRALAKELLCSNGLRQCGMAVLTYVSESEGDLTGLRNGINGSEGGNWIWTIEDGEYLGNASASNKVASCPDGVYGGKPLSSYPIWWLRIGGASYYAHVASSRPEFNDPIVPGGKGETDPWGPVGSTGIKGGSLKNQQAAKSFDALLCEWSSSDGDIYKISGNHYRGGNKPNSLGILWMDGSTTRTKAAEVVPYWVFYIPDISTQR